MVMLGVAAAAPAWERNPHPSKGLVKSFEIYNWREAILGDLQVEGLSLDLEEEGSFGTKNRFGARVAFPVTDRTNVNLAYNAFDHGGTIDKAVRFNGRNYAAGAAIRIESTWFDIWGARQCSRWEDGYWDILYGIKVCETNLDVAGFTPIPAVAYQSGSWSQIYPIPYLGLGYGARVFSRFWAEGHLKFIATNAGGAAVRSYDFDINGAYSLNPTFKDEINDIEWLLVVGYRTFLLDADKDVDNVKLGYRGPTFGVVGRW